VPILDFGFKLRVAALKGGMLVAAMVGIDSRSTMDLDASIRNTTLSEESIRTIFETITTIDIGDDFVT